MEQFKIDQLEANLERFKIDHAAINSEATKQLSFLQATIEKNKVEADRQFAEIMNALKALQPPTTLPAAIPRFEENSGQSFSSVEVEKEGKDIGFLGALVTRSEVADGYGGEKLPQTADSMLKNLNSEDISTCIRSPESINNQESRITIGEGDQSRVPEKNVPSHVPRKQQLGGLIFDAEVEIPVGFDLRTFEGLYCDLGRGHKRRTWNPGIIYHQSRRNILSGLINNVSQHFELLAYRHAKRIIQRRVWDPGITITGGDVLKQHLEDKQLQLAARAAELKLEKLQQLQIRKESSSTIRSSICYRSKALWQKRTATTAMVAPRRLKQASAASLLRASLLQAAASKLAASLDIPRLENDLETYALPLLPLLLLLNVVQSDEGTRRLQIPETPSCCHTITDSGVALMLAGTLVSKSFIRQALFTYMDLEGCGSVV
ncbi:hypothetical protein Tco_0116668 [Tanacetum coccineum]